MPYASVGNGGVLQKIHCKNADAAKVEHMSEVGWKFSIIVILGFFEVFQCVVVSKSKSGASRRSSCVL